MKLFVLFVKRSLPQHLAISISFFILFLKTIWDWIFNGETWASAVLAQTVVKWTLPLGWIWTVCIQYDVSRVENAISNFLFLLVIILKMMTSLFHISP